MSIITHQLLVAEDTLWKLVVGLMRSWLGWKSRCRPIETRIITMIGSLIGEVDTRLRDEGGSLAVFPASG
jgi:hypothetical protein